jgi:SAM-dependent methyltransferase
MSSNSVDNPFFARLWTVMSGHEPESVRRLWRENLAGLSGRVLEVGAGTGTNFEFYPDAVTEVVAVEPERRLAALAQKAASAAPVPVTVSTDTVEQYTAGEPFDAVVCSLVLCSVDEPDSVVRQLHSLLRPGGELRYLEHVASSGPRARLQKLADATVWPRLLGNCHTHRHTEETIVGAGFQVTGARREWTVPRWVPVPVSEFALGRAIRPA